MPRAGVVDVPAAAAHVQALHGHGLARFGGLRGLRHFGADAMSEFLRPYTLADVNSMDERELIAGYMSGYRGDDEPISSIYSRSFWAGWRNGAADSGRREPDAAQAHVAREYAQSAGWH